jgi:hypothetical protein
MQNENRRFELRGVDRRAITMARRMKHCGLHVADRQEVLQEFATAP